MNPVKYDDLIDKQIRNLSFSEKKEVFDFVEFLKIKRIKNEDVFLAALKEAQIIGRKIGVTDNDIEEEIKTVRKRIG